MQRETFQVSGDDVAGLYDKLATTFMAPFVETIVDAVDIRDGEGLLDVACGSGYAAREARRRSKEIQIDGVDLNQSMLNVASHFDSSIQWSHADADNLPFSDDTFDAVICQQGIQFFPDAKLAANEIARVLKPSGRLAITM